MKKTILIKSFDNLNCFDCRRGNDLRKILSQEPDAGGFFLGLVCEKVI